MAGRKKVGLIVNPVAGLGGKAGLKGSDGREIQIRARERGAEPVSPGRAIDALEELKGINCEIDLVTVSDKMGEKPALRAGFSPRVIMNINPGHTSAEDTMRAAEKMTSEHDVDLLLFAGGDGTARDINRAIGEYGPVLGIPAGVKIHSAVYASNPRRAGKLAFDYLKGEAGKIRRAEVMDIDEKSFRNGRLSARLYGYLKIPYQENMVQDLKAGSSLSDGVALETIADWIIDKMRKKKIYLIGPGTTTAKIMEKLELDNTLLGVDAVRNYNLIGRDLYDEEILNLIADNRAGIVVTVIGGQGYIFGRGNQQFSPEVISRVGPENIKVIATEQKISDLEGSPLLVDTGDERVNDELRGYREIIVGYDRKIVYPVE